MNSTPNLTRANPDTVQTARADERLAHVHEQIALADEQLARVTEQLSKMEHGAARRPAAVPSWQPSRQGRPVLRGLVGLILAACIGAAAYAAQSSEAARMAIAQWAPSVMSTSWLPVEKSRISAQPGSSPVQLAAAETTVQQPALATQAPVQDVPPAAAPAPLSPELTQRLQMIAHDIATVEQGIEQLKANQAQMAADNARTIEQLKASQEQLASLAAKSFDRPSGKPKPSELDTRAKTPAPPPQPKPVASATRKPPPKQPPPARAHTQPVQLQPEEQ